MTNIIANQPPNTVTIDIPDDRLNNVLNFKGGWYEHETNRLTCYYFNNNEYKICPSITLKNSLSFIHQIYGLYDQERKIYIYHLHYNISLRVVILDEEGKIISDEEAYIYP